MRRASFTIVFHRRAFFLACLFFVPGCTTTHAGEPPLKVLFIGNSYTYVNDLPSLIVGLADAAGGRKIQTDQYVVGGYTLEQQTNDPKAIAKIRERKWDMVVLQENSLARLTACPVLVFWGVGRMAALTPAVACRLSGRPFRRGMPPGLRRGHARGQRSASCRRSWPPTAASCVRRGVEEIFWIGLGGPLNCGRIRCCRCSLVLPVSVNLGTVLSSQQASERVSVDKTRLQNLS